MNKSLKPSIFKTSLLALLLTSALSAQGAGLGKLSVYSGIGQQLKAEVALAASSAELGAMTAKLASHEAFREAGIEYMSLLSDVRIELDKNAAGQPILRLSSSRPISEPFLHFLVELSWTSGRMVREYTFLLDPPEMLQVAKPASVVAPAAPATKTLPPAATSVQPKPAATASRQTQAGTGDYQVKQGDTLGKIARETRLESVTLDQMLVALFNGNQDAFADSNMNRLRAGKILRVPSAEEVGKVDPAEARKLVINHTSEFNAYRNRLALATTEAKPAESAPRQQVSGTIKPQVDDKVPAPVARDKLEVSRTEPAKAAKPATGSSLEEDLIARDKALREASERIAQLEKNIDNLKKLVEVKSQTGAKLQQESEAVQVKPAEKPVEAAKPETPPAAAPTPLPAATEQAAKPEEAKPAAPVEAAKPAEPVKPPSAAAKKPATPPPPPTESSFIAENPEIVYGGGGLIALLLGYLGYSSRRRKKAPAEEQSDLSVAPIIAGTAGAQEAKSTPIPGTPAASFDTGEISIQGEFSEGGLLTNEEIVDPVAEADVLMAYGRDRQAEEILQEGLNKDPSRPAIHMKLLELYAKQENIAQFETVAEKLHGLNNGRGADWDRTLAVARTLGLSGGIFGGVAAAVETAKPVADNVEPSVTVESLQQPVEEPSPVAMPQVAEEIEAVVTPAVEETPSLEFDLDLGTTASSEVAAVAEQAVSAPPEEDIGLDFDFDLGTPEAKEAVEAVVAKAEAPAEVNLSELDFDLDLGSPVEPETAAVAEPESMEEVSVDVPVTGGLSDLKLDFDLELDQEPVETAVPESLAPIAVEAISTEPEILTASTRPDNPEVATKLELAQAYEEMGDLEGARELLNEVLNEGSQAQQAQAQAKLDQLGA